MSEPGFEIARAFVAVSPDASDFAAALDEQVGGLALSVAVTPNTSDFAAAMDDALGGLSLSVAVTPDMSDFASAVDEQGGGLTLPVTITPDTTDLAAAVDEQGLTASVSLTPDTSGAADFGDAVNEQAGTIAVPVTPVPEMADFEADLAERADGITVPVGVYPAVDPSAFQDQLTDEIGTPVVGVDVQASLANMAEHLADSFAGAIPVPVIPDMTDFADAVQEEASGISVGVSVLPDAASLDALPAQIQDAVGDEGIVIPVSVDTGTAVDSLGQLAQAEDDAAAEASGVTGQYAALQEQFSAMEGELDALNSRFGVLSGGMASASEESSSAASVLDAVNSQFAAVGSEVESLGGELAGLGGDVSGAGEQLGLVSSMVGELQASLSAADDAVSVFRDTTSSAMTEAGEAASGAQQQVYSLGGIYESAGSAAADAADPMARLSSTVGEVSDAAPAASDAASGLSGVLGELGSRLSYFAVDPFMWMYAAPVVIGGVTDAIKALDGTSASFIQELEQQDNATGYNIAGYQKLISQLGEAAAGYERVAAAAGDNVRSGAGLQEEYSQLTAVQQQYIAELDNLTGHLGSLQDAYGLTQTQAEELAKAAGVQYTALLGSGTAAEQAMAKIQAYATSNETASGAVAQLTQDQEVFSSSAFTAASRVGDMDNAFTTLAGNFISVQQAQLNVTGGFDGLQAASQAAGASMTGTNLASVGLQQSFYSQAGAIEQAANAMVQQGDSAQTVTGYINTQITALSNYEGGSKNASGAVQDLKKWEDSLTGSLQEQGSYMSTTLSNDLDNAILKYAGVQTAVNNYANALVDFGKNSPQAKNAQDLLTDSIVKGGVAAGDTTTDIAQMISQMEKIPLKEAIQIVLNAEGQYAISGEIQQAQTVTSTGQVDKIGGHTAAYGGLITGGSGHPRADDIPAMLSHGEYVVQSSAVSKYGTGFLDSLNAGHFASGGSVTGSYSGTAAGMGAWLGSQYNATNQMLVQAVESAMAAAVAAGQASSRPPVIMQFVGTQTPTAEQAQAMMTQLSAAVGVS